MHLINETLFPSECLAIQDRFGRDQLLVVAKVTLEIDEQGEASVANEPQPIIVADEFHGAPEDSSPRLESDLAFSKPATDVILIGHACAPAGSGSRGAAQVDVTLRIGSWAKTLRVFGKRRWLLGLGRRRPSKPEPFDRIPLVWERAFGGRDETPKDEARHAADPRNPTGVGFRAKRSQIPSSALALPNIEYPQALIRQPGERPSPAGFGFVGRGWEPRVGFAGTYDDAWMKHRSPLLPDDFDDRYFQGAPMDQVLPNEPQPGTPVEVFGATHDQPLRFDIPAIRPQMRAVNTDLDKIDLTPRLDTIVVDADTRRATLVWRAVHPMGPRPTQWAAVRVSSDV